jgi:hypothetical protein
MALCTHRSRGMDLLSAGLSGGRTNEQVESKTKTGAKYLPCRLIDRIWWGGCVKHLVMLFLMDQGMFSAW